MMGRLLALSALFFLIGCNSDFLQKTVNGNGNVVSETRSAESFESIEVEGGLMVIFKKAEVPSIKVTADENLLTYIETNIVGGTLTIKPSKGIVPMSRYDLIVRVSSPGISSASVLGSGYLSVDTLSGNNVKVNLNGSGRIGVGVTKASVLRSELLGSGHIELKTLVTEVNTNLMGSGRFTLSGETSKAKHKLEGSGIYDAYELTTNNTEMVVWGSGIAKIHAKSSLIARIDGSGEIRYKGKPQTTQFNVTGSGKILGVD